MRPISRREKPRFKKEFVCSLESMGTSLCFCVNAQVMWPRSGPRKRAQNGEQCEITDGADGRRVSPAVSSRVDRKLYSVKTKKPMRPIRAAGFLQACKAC